MRLLRLPEVLYLTGLGRSTLYRLISDGQFPTQITITLKSVGWLEQEVQDWIKERVEAERASKKSA